MAPNGLAEALEWNLGRGTWFCPLSLAKFQDSKDDSKWNPLFLGAPSFLGLPGTALALLPHSHPMPADYNGGKSKFLAKETVKSPSRCCSLVHHGSLLPHECGDPHTSGVKGRAPLQSMSLKPAVFPFSTPLFQVSQTGASSPSPRGPTLSPKRRVSVAPSSSLKLRVPSMGTIPSFRCSALGKGNEEEGSSLRSWGEGAISTYVLTSQTGGRLPQEHEKKRRELRLALTA